MPLIIPNAVRFSSRNPPDWFDWRKGLKIYRETANVPVTKVRLSYYKKDFAERKRKKSRRDAGAPGSVFAAFRKSLLGAPPSRRQPLGESTHPVNITTLSL